MTSLPEMSATSGSLPLLTTVENSASSVPLGATSSAPSTPGVSSWMSVPEVTLSVADDRSVVLEDDAVGDVGRCRRRVAVTIGEGRNQRDRAGRQELLDGQRVIGQGVVGIVAVIVRLVVVATIVVLDRQVLHDSELTGRRIDAQRKGRRVARVDAAVTVGVDAADDDAALVLQADVEFLRSSADRRGHLPPRSPARIAASWRQGRRRRSSPRH